MSDSWGVNQERDGERHVLSAAVRGGDEQLF